MSAKQGKLLKAKCLQLTISTIQNVLKKCQKHLLAARNAKGIANFCRHHSYREIK